MFRLAANEFPLTSIQFERVFPNQHFILRIKQIQTFLLVFEGDDRTVHLRAPTTTTVLHLNEKPYFQIRKQGTLLRCSSWSVSKQICLLQEFTSDTTTLPL